MFVRISCCGEVEVRVTSLLVIWVLAHSARVAAVLEVASATCRS